MRDSPFWHWVVAELMPTDERLISIVLPVYNESEAIIPLLEGLREAVALPHESLIVYDFDEDTTLPPARRLSEHDATIHLVRNKYGRGVLNALKSGLEMSQGDVVCVVMGDQSDDLSQIEHLAELVRQGASVAAPSRYMPGGRQIGGPLLKRTLSRLAGTSLFVLAGIGTHDPTNNYKAYSSSFLDSVTIESTSGFELALELTAKAHAAGELIVEIPTTWTDRTAGKSNFKLAKWLPAYLRWYWYAIRNSQFSRRTRIRVR